MGERNSTISDFADSLVQHGYQNFSSVKATGYFVVFSGTWKWPGQHYLRIFQVGIFDVYSFLCPVQVCLPVGDMSDSGSQLGSMGSLTMKSQLQITGKS